MIYTDKLLQPARHIAPAWLGIQAENEPQTHAKGQGRHSGRASRCEE